jgi:hypothetical protein
VKRFWLGCVALVTALVHVAAALADPSLAPRPMVVSWLGHVPVLTFSGSDFIDAAVADKLSSGLPQRIVTRVYAYPERGGEEPITVAALSCRVVYDLWEGVYRVQAQTETSDRSFAASDLPSVVRACVDVRKLAFNDADAFTRYRGQRIYFAALIELNPLSPDTVQRIRRWLSKSGGDQMRGDAFFGSFVSIFVSRRMGSAERSMAFRSEVFSVPP